MRASSPFLNVSSFLRLLPRLHVTSIPPFIFPSTTRCSRQFLCKMWPIQLAFRFLISCRIFLCSLTLSNTSSFLTWSVQLIFSILLQYHISKLHYIKINWRDPERQESSFKMGHFSAFEERFWVKARRNSWYLVSVNTNSNPRKQTNKQTYKQTSGISMSAACQTLWFITSSPLSDLTESKQQLSCEVYFRRLLNFTTRQKKKYRKW